MSLHHSDQMSQRSQFSRIALWRCSQNVFVFVIVIVIVFVFVIFLARSSLLITVIKCLKGHKSFRLLSERVLYMCLSLSLFFFGQLMSPHHSDQMSQRSQVSRVALWRCSLNVSVFVFVIVIVIVFVLVIFFGQVKSPDHSDQMCQRTQVSIIAFWKVSLIVFVIVFVFVFVFVFVIVFFMVRSCLLITLIKCLKSHKSLGSLFEGVL